MMQIKLTIIKVKTALTVRNTCHTMIGINSTVLLMILGKLSSISLQDNTKMSIILSLLAKKKSKSYAAMNNSKNSLMKATKLYSILDNIIPSYLNNGNHQKKIGKRLTT